MTALKPIKYQFRIHCPWKDCDGVINITRDIEDYCAHHSSDNTPQKVPWMIHTFMCPKCHNAVGSLDIMPDGFATLDAEGVDIHTKKGFRNITKSKERDEQHRAMNRYLKPWARWPVKKPKKVN